MKPAVIKGKVVPRRTACGRMRAPATAHFAHPTPAVPASAGKRASYAQLVLARKAG